MFSAFLKADDARRASDVVERLLADGLRDYALTGSVAIEARLREHGRPLHSSALNDVDLVMDSFSAIPAALAEGFLLNHIHPQAPEGKMLLQVIDRERAVRVDVFRPFGTTLSRACVVDEQTGPLPVLTIEDLVARTTAHLCGRLRKAAHRRLGRPPPGCTWNLGRGDTRGTSTISSEPWTCCFRGILHRRDCVRSVPQLRAIPPRVA